MKNYSTPELNMTSFEAENIMESLSNNERGIDMGDYFNDQGVFFMKKYSQPNIFIKSLYRAQVCVELPSLFSDELGLDVGDEGDEDE